MRAVQERICVDIECEERGRERAALWKAWDASYQPLVTIGGEAMEHHDTKGVVGEVAS